MKKQNEQRLVPKLRFKGFSEDWEQCKLGELGKDYSGLTGKTKKDFGHGESLYVPYKNIFNNHIVDVDNLEKVNVSSKQNKVKYGDIFFTISSEVPEEVGMSSVMRKDINNLYLNSFSFGLRPYENSELDMIFSSYLFRTLTFRKKMYILAQGISRYNISKANVMKLEIALPSVNEQKKIGRLLNTLDSMITLHKRKLKIIDETIHELREQLFSTKYIAGKKVKSKKMKLNDFLEEVIEHSNKENQYPLLSSTNNGIETRSGRVSGSSNIGYKILRENQLVLSPQNLWLGNININRDFEVGIVSPSYKVFDIKNIKIIYLENILKTERIKYNYDKISNQDASVVRRKLEMKEFLNLEVRVTQKNEQEKLVKTFVQLSNIKFSLRSKIKILEKLKILYLDKMFI